jgi:3-phenylpropionate/cinnamic acid dioxygenase small subunit
MTEIDKALQHLIDRAAIQDLLVRYAHCVDRRDLEGVAACFTADAEYRGSLGDGTIENALVALRDRMARYESTMHLLGNQLIEIDGDRARSETYAIAHHRLNNDGDRRTLTVGVRYADDLVRREGRWVICRRVVHMEWERDDAVFLPEDRD